MENNPVFPIFGIAAAFIFSHAAGMHANGPLPPNTSVQSFALSGGKIFAGTAGKGVFLSLDNGTNWTAINNGLPESTSVVSLVVSGGKIFAGTWNHGVFLSTDTGTNWTAVNNGLPATSIIRSLAVSGGKLFAGTELSGVFLSTNSGTGWTAVNNGLPATNSARSLVVNGGRLFAGISGYGVFLSTDYGASWKAVNSGLPVTMIFPSLAIGGGSIFAGTEGRGVYLSMDNGAHWTAVNNGIYGNVLSIAVNRCLVFAGTTEKGVFFSRDGGITWKSAGDSLSKMDALAVAVGDSTVFAGISGKGVVRKPLSELVAFTRLDVKQVYVCPENFYIFTLDSVDGSATFDIYGNDVPILHNQNKCSKLPTDVVVSAIENGTGKPLSYQEMITFYSVARSNSQIMGISNFVYKNYILYCGAQTPETIQKGPAIRISGPSIDCSSLKGMKRISLYTLKGEKVWEKKVFGARTMMPAHLPKGIYAMEVNGPFGNASTIIMKR